MKIVAVYEFQLQSKFLSLHIIYWETHLAFDVGGFPVLGFGNELEECDCGFLVHV